MLQLMIRPLLVNATCHWLYMTEVELGDCKITMHACSCPMPAKHEYLNWTDFGRSSTLPTGRIKKRLQGISSAVLASSRPITRYLSNPLWKTILCCSRKHPATWFCVSSDCITRVFTTPLKFLFLYNRPAQVGESPLGIREKLSVQGLVHSEKGLCSHQNQELFFLEYICLWWRWSKEEKSHGFCEQTEWRIRYHLLQILHLQWQRGFQDGIIVFPCGIWKVTKLRSCSHTTPEGFEKAALTVYSGFVFKLCQKNHVIIVTSSFLKKTPYFKTEKCFPSTQRF